MPETNCFCGCGRSAAFGQARAVNDAARRVAGVRPQTADAERLLALALTVLHDDACARDVVRTLRVWLSAP
ncbi:hypothetical protein C8N24_0043 [Solirubrobacter pauli]|uniref:Uncharacterized protein n=1 Tax=Solirubrobacter pauli TaxID=166793 RepID=A0A660LB43_9ACTN|nr:hypothetical protein [Solirubrobacter pauli]RKQ90244.1 hypothetical protein C8N24_0043 [Solirubrobacter pauli]